MSGIKDKYIQELTRMELEIKEVEAKAQRAMRVTLWLKIIMAIATVSAVGAWLQNHQVKELWAVIILGAKIADVMFDTLPYMQQRITLPQLKIKLVDIMLEMHHDLDRLNAGRITDTEATNSYYAHLNAWTKSLE